MMNVQEEIDKLTVRIDDIQRQIDQEEQGGSEAKANSLRGVQVALINKQTALINKQAHQIKILSLLHSEQVFDTHALSDALSSSTENFKKSKLGEAYASDFKASRGLPFSGFGLTSHCPFFDPTDIDSDLGGRTTTLHSFFNKTVGEISTALAGENPNSIAAKLKQTIIVYNDLSKVAETSISVKTSCLGRNLSIQNHHLDMIMAFVPQLQSTTLSKAGGKLMDKNCSIGIASEGSIPDGYLKDSEMNVRGVFEVTNGTDAPAEGIRQGASSASNVALCQLQHGVKVDDVVVPVISSNGYLMQFAAVVMLKPSFPMLVMLSPVLDLTDDSMLLESARLLCCVKIMAYQPLISHRNQMAIAEIPRLTLAYSTREYHEKPMADFFPSTGTIQTSLFHFFKVMSRLHSDRESKHYTVFPLCVREYQEDLQETVLLFPNLSLYSYQIGLPKIRAQRESFLHHCKLATASFHRVGVVHLDLYLSNIMWREVSEVEVQLKFIDWDAAQLIYKRMSHPGECSVETRRPTHECPRQEPYDGLQERFISQ
mmetsp:Transcript_5093/g.7105  ORF Transcript_5093/g.7105 Transcript_5093/m.7105 type:complete len:541 (+) Transcript_5093:788-2410(+)